MGCVFFLNEKFVELWVGSDSFSGALVSGLIVVYSFGHILRETIYHNLFAVGKMRSLALADFITTCCHLMLSVTFCYLWGIVGIVLAAIISVWGINFVMQAKILMNFLRMGKFDTSLFFAKSLSIASVPLLLFAWLFYHNQHQMLTTILFYIVLYCCVLAATLYLFDRDFKEFILDLRSS